MQTTFFHIFFKEKKKILKQKQTNAIPSGPPIDNYSGSFTKAMQIDPKLLNLSDDADDVGDGLMGLSGCFCLCCLLVTRKSIHRLTVAGYTLWESTDCLPDHEDSVCQKTNKFFVNRIAGVLIKKLNPHLKYVLVQCGELFLHIFIA